jgi:hypothetical protein
VIMSLTTNIMCMIVEVAEAEIAAGAEIAVIVVNGSDKDMCGCDFPILLVEAYCRISTNGKTKFFPLGRGKFPPT